MNLLSMLRYGKNRLEEASVADASVDAMELLQYACEIDRSYYYMHMDEEVSSEKQEKYEMLLEKRAAHIPLQQITGYAYFMGLEFKVNEHVLIPRFDTEILVEETLKYVKGKMQILDMCTGSGCIILSIVEARPEVTGTGVDISPQALEVACENAKRLNIPVTFVQSDLFAHIQEKYDIIVSNPPYIPTEVIKTLDTEVKDHEPLLALDGLTDGLHFYREIIRQAKDHLKDGGHLCFEIGHDQGDSVAKLMETSGYIDIRVVKDLSGLDRVVVGGKPCLTN